MRVVWMTVLGLGMTAGVASAQLAPPHHSVDPGSPRSNVLAGSSAEALVAGKPVVALQMADQAIAADPQNPWSHYDRAAALSDLGRTDEAVAQYEVAQRSFSTQDAWGKSIAMYGKANALSRVGRCDEAKPAYEAYASFVERSDPGAAGLARRYAADCQPRRP
jgi:tetratricopeptide (TPR) repeat protein